MLPQLLYKCDLEIECLDTTGASDVLKVFVIDSVSTVPLISASIQMPISEVVIE